MNAPGGGGRRGVVLKKTTDGMIFCMQKALTGGNSEFPFHLWYSDDARTMLADSCRDSSIASSMMLRRWWRLTVFHLFSSLFMFLLQYCKVLSNFILKHSSLALVQRVWQKHVCNYFQTVIATEIACYPFQSCEPKCCHHLFWEQFDDIAHVMVHRYLSQVYFPWGVNSIVPSRLDVTISY